VGARALGRRPWGCNSILFAVILNVFLSRNAYFLEKSVKIVSASGAPPPDPRADTPAYYYNFVEFISSGKCISFRSKKKQVTTANVLPLLLPHFFTYFLIQTV